MDSYRIPTKSGASEYVDKRSRFLGLVRPVGSEDEARTIIAACKKQYHDARHNCWCYLIEEGGIVLEKDIRFYSMCEHHLLPFYGTAAVAYIPDGEVVGLSKIARTVEVYARRL